MKKIKNIVDKRKIQHYNTLIRNQFNIVEKDPIEIYVDDSSIILKKYEPNCVFCGSTENLVEYKDKEEGIDKL